MTRNQKPTGRAVSMPIGLLSGAITSVGITLIGAAITAKLLESETMGENTVGYAVMIMLLLGSFVGARISQKKIKRRYLAVSFLSGIIYLITLLSITALFFGGQYEAVAVTSILVWGGCAIALLIAVQPNRKEKWKKLRIANR